MGILFMWTLMRNRETDFYDASQERKIEQEIRKEIKRQSREIQGMSYRVHDNRVCTTGVMGMAITPRPDPSYEVNDQGELIERN